LEGNGSRDSHKGNGYKESETMFTLNTVEQHGVAVTESEESTGNDESGRTLGLDRASYNQGKNAKFGFSVEEEKIGVQTAKGPGAVCTSIVRRLTPTECERLQGFPDGWTDIGEWTDEKGKIHKPADAPRYKAMGNSIARPFWKWLTKRISAQYERAPTLGSLFTGVGGFDLCWAEVNGTKSVLWQSEIEPFAIAVCKRHFGDEDEGTEGDVKNYL
jgi:DNA (cytosine-5)-methyltransferase 1